MVSIAMDIGFHHMSIEQQHVVVQTLRCLNKTAGVTTLDIEYGLEQASIEVLDMQSQIEARLRWGTAQEPDSILSAIKLNSPVGNTSILPAKSRKSNASPGGSVDTSNQI